MRRLVSIAASVVLLATAWVCLFGRPERPPAPEPETRAATPPEPLRTPTGAALESAAAELPDGTVVVHVRDAEQIDPPFELTPDVSAVDGLALVAPVGSPDDERGRAVLSLELPEPGTYHAWVRGRWPDECGNSICVQVGPSRERTAGNDSVYNLWHWVPAGAFELAGPTVPLAVIQRETGAAVDQVLLTTDERFRPVGPVLSGRMRAGLRRFADAFDRSPGHGLGKWDAASGRWTIRFSLDPNRIPNQYSLTGKATSGRAVLAARGRPWKGCRLAFSLFPPGPGRCGAVLDRAPDGGHRLAVQFDVTEAGARLLVDAAGERRSHDLGRRIRIGQWHRIAIERWAWVLSVFVDGERVLRTADLEPQVGGVGLTVSRGEAVFDDVAITELRWLADDGQALRIPWRVPPGASWFRPDGELALLGESGSIRSPDIGLPVRSVLTETPSGNHFREPASRLPTAELSAGTEKLRLRRVAICHGERRPDRFRIGPYHFTERRIEDPSDYLDFTAEEWAKIRNSPEVDKLRRRKKYIPLVGRGTHCVWSRRAGAWRVHGGRLSGRGPDAELRYTQQIVSDFELRAKVRLARRAAAEFVLYAGNGEGFPVRLATSRPTEAPAGLPLEFPGDGDWHRLAISARGETIEAAIDDQAPKTATLSRGDHGGVLLRVPAGRALFDDIEFLVPRSQPDGAFYGFDRREADWWRSGGTWMDHGGMACVLASHWISLIAPDGRGTLWNKRRFGPDALVAFNIEENSKWFGWSEHPTHVHYPFDNICVHLGTAADETSGYRLEVNARDRTATVLYRNGKEVASVDQDAEFPMQYVGGHAPYRPRKNRISLSKRGRAIRALVNGVEVLRWTDPDPRPVERVGLGGHDTRVNFSHIEVRDLTE